MAVTQVTDDLPLPMLPRSLAEVFRPELPSLGDEIIHAIRAQIPEYARPLDGPYGKAIRAGVRHGISQFVEQLADPTASREGCYSIHRKLGGNELYEGRSLDTLQAAYRVGARVAWRRIMQVGKASGLSSAVMSQLADAVFAYLDKLASAALDGYLEAKANSSGALAAWRRRLLQLLLEQPPAPREAITDLARLAGWPLPEQASPVLVRLPPQAGLSSPPAELDTLVELDVLAELDVAAPRLILRGGTTDARIATLRAAFPDCQLAVGPRVELALLAESLRWARLSLDLAERGAIPNTPVIRSADHLSTVLLHSDPALVAQLRRQLLVPLDQLTTKRRRRMTETLRAWLEMRGNVLDMAARLDVHPQTVRYRLRQLETLFGTRLGDPATRFELELILRAGDGQEPEADHGRRRGWRTADLARSLPAPRKSTGDQAGARH